MHQSLRWGVLHPAIHEYSHSSLLLAQFWEVMHDLQRVSALVSQRSDPWEASWPWLMQSGSLQASITHGQLYRSCMMKRRRSSSWYDYSHWRRSKWLLQGWQLNEIRSRLWGRRPKETDQRTIHGTQGHHQPWYLQKTDNCWNRIGSRAEVLHLWLAQVSNHHWVWRENGHESWTICSIRMASSRQAMQLYEWGNQATSREKSRSALKFSGLGIIEKGL